VSRTQSLRASGGFSFIELVVVIGLIGVISAISIPWFLTYVEAEKIRGAAREVATLLNQARQLAVTRNTSFSVEGQLSPLNQVRFCSGVAIPCPGGAVWVAEATDANGWIRLDNNTQLVLAQPITFSALGAATPGGRLRVAQGPGAAAPSSCLDVVVSGSGRVQIATSLSCP
jgi:prepilin-type N-terminal cleavage/methylation domain-containing protein